MANALILAGAVAKGAFEAGALAVLAARGVRFDRIVSSSAGSLNGLVFAAGTRVGRPVDVAESLVVLWSERARWSRVFDFDGAALFSRRGVSTGDKVRELLLEETGRWLDDFSGTRVPIELRLVVTLLDGTVEPLGPGRATTFERVLRFRGEDLDSAATRPRVIEAALASAAFPLMFLPIDLGPGLGLAVDGGAVDNAPIREAISGSDIDRVYVVSTDPPEVPPVTRASGEALVSRLADILVGERLFRDMAEAYEVNRALAALAALVNGGVLTGEQLDRVKGALRWSDRRPIEIVPIRPSRPLRGGAFSGFFSRETRLDYIRLGREAAEAALER
jgi:NTE family protein